MSDDMEAFLLLFGVDFGSIIRMADDMEAFLVFFSVLLLETS
jgi:hypothetical protein